MKRTVLALLLLFIVALSHAKDKLTIPSEHIYGPLIGKRVTLDALVWHHTKGISGRVVLPSGHDIYISEPWIRRPDGTLDPRLPHGKLVRLIGVLTFEHSPPVPRTVQGYPQGFSYFALALESFTVIERAEEAFPQLNPK